MRLLYLVIIFLLILPSPSGGVCYPVALRDAPIYQSFGYRQHVGIDLIVPVGTPVRAVRSGMVIESAEDSSVYGRYIMILHTDGYASLYAHLSKLYARKGDSVQGCEIVALSGGAKGADGSGQSSGYHLHWEVRPPGHTGSNDYNINPFWYIRAHRIRRYISL